VSTERDGHYLNSGLNAHKESFAAGPWSTTTTTCHSRQVTRVTAEPVHMVEGCHLVELPRIHDAAGNLTFVEGASTFPFDVQRVYYLYDVPGGESRAGHATRAAAARHRHQRQLRRARGRRETRRVVQPHGATKAC